LVFAACFMIVVFPYIRQNKTLFGRYFYNVNTTFYMWYDSWEEVSKGTRDHGDKVGWPDMPEDQIPSMRKYLRDHTNRQIAARVVGGTGAIWGLTWRSYGYAPFVIFYLVCLAAIALQNKTEFRRWIAMRKNAVLAFFVVAYFGGYLLVYAWYTAIALSDRFALALFLPAMFVFVRFLALAQRENWRLARIRGRSIPASAVGPAVLAMLLAYAVFVFPYRISTMFGGM
jgi:hypothetical protein